MHFIILSSSGTQQAFISFMQKIPLLAFCIILENS